MKKLSLIPILFLLLVLVTNCKKDAADTDKNLSGKTEYNGKVNVDKAEVTIGIPDVVDVRIPQGAFSGDATFTIKALDLASLPASTDFNMYESFEITSSSGSTFAKSLEIKIKYDDTKGEKIAKNNGAAFYNESSKKWIPFNDVVVDTVQKIVTIRTNHLTKLGKYSYSYKVLGYTDWASSSHFYIYWTEPGVMTNTEYKSPYVNYGSDPQYIQDILFYLEASWTAFKAANLEVPNSRINVYVDPLPAGTDGVTSFTGKITINQKMAGSNYATIEENLPMVCAHELLHYVQDYYYVQLFADYATKWWLEATATQADRIVWPQNTKFESLDPGLDLSINLVNSWDDCLSDPNWYIAGKFLCYMANYRTGTKMSIPEIIKECGKATNVSYYRTIVDTYIKTKLGSTGIGDEFRDFVKYAFEGKGNLKYPDEAKPALTPALANQKNSILRTSYDVSTNEITVPYLAAGFLKCGNYIGEKQNVYAKLNTKSSEVDVFVYKSTIEGTRTFIQQMNEKDSVKIELAGNNEWIDLLVVNKTKEAKGSASATFRCEKLPFISSVLPAKAKVGDEITISGLLFGSKNSASDIYFNTVKVNALSSDVKSWADNKIVVKVPVGAETGKISIKIYGAASNNADLEIIKPAISFISPAKTKVGDEITISGTYLGAQVATSDIYFNSIKVNALASEVKSWTENQIIVKVPVGAVTGTVSIKMNDVPTNSVDIEILKVFISSVLPAKVQAGDEVTITGISFGSIASTSDIYFNTIKVNSLSSEVKSWSDNKIVVKVPVGATTGTIYVKTNEGKSNDVGFEITKLYLSKAYLALANVDVTYLDQSNVSTTKSEIIQPMSPLGSPGKNVVTWDGNSFTLNAFIAKTSDQDWDRTWVISGTISEDQKTLLSFSCEKSEVYKWVNVFMGTTTTKEIHRDSKITANNIPSVIIPSMSTDNWYFVVTGTSAVTKCTYTYKETEKTVTLKSDGTSSTVVKSSNVIDVQAVKPAGTGIEIYTGPYFQLMMTK